MSGVTSSVIYSRYERCELWMVNRRHLMIFFNYKLESVVSRLNTASWECIAMFRRNTGFLQLIIDYHSAQPCCIFGHFNLMWLYFTIQFILLTWGMYSNVLLKQRVFTIHLFAMSTQQNQVPSTIISTLSNYVVLSI